MTSTLVSSQILIEVRASTPLGRSASTYVSLTVWVPCNESVYSLPNHTDITYTINSTTLSKSLPTF